MRLATIKLNYAETAGIVTAQTILQYPFGDGKMERIKMNQIYTMGTDVGSTSFK